MDKVKEAIVEYVAALNGGGKPGGVLCLNGPPGVGKTSIAYSIGEALGRKVIKISASGVDDTSILRGFRRTYAGAQPGVILERIRKAGVSNPIIILDEGEKPAHPSFTNALLELLDPVQNTEFRDHYLGIGFDLSDVLFVLTTNNVDELPCAVRDRLDVIRLNAYSDAEKLDIARDYLVPRQLAACGLSPKKFGIKDCALERLIADYTQEAGVRELERKIRSICRKLNVAAQSGLMKSSRVPASKLESLIGPPRVFKTLVPANDAVGSANGLYYSDAGGGIIPIQVSVRPADKFSLAVTGLPGRMTNESAQYASEMLHFLSVRYGIDTNKLRRTSIHVHLVDGSSPKDGPSAGTAMATAIVSALKGISIRHDLAMTGEVDLYGNVHPIGGLPEKLEGARKAGATTVLIPYGNQPDLYDVPLCLKENLLIIPVRHMDEVLAHALTEPLPQISHEAPMDTVMAEPTLDDIRRVFHYVTAGSPLVTRFHSPPQEGSPRSLDGTPQDPAP